MYGVLSLDNRRVKTKHLVKFYVHLCVNEYWVSGLLLVRLSSLSVL